jgi:NADPH:quinone reductase-like Zn-dependent oxidoreductase
MRALVATEFGGPETVAVIDLPAPAPTSGKVAVRVHAAGVNPVDNALRAGWMQPYFPTTPPVVLGVDLAGTVEAVGEDVLDLQPGDAVVGHTLVEAMLAGTFAEHVVAVRSAFVRKPDGLDFVRAAAIPHAGLAAAQAIHDVLAVGAGDVVLIHAGAGGVGTIATQLARRAGATVLATGSERNQDYLRSLGANAVRYDADLAAQVRAAAPGGVDVILDLIGGPGVEQTVPFLREGGRLASTVDMQIGRFGGTIVAGHPDQERLAALVADVADGTLQVHIDGTFPLEQGAAALDRIAQGHVRGKLIITMVDAADSASGAVG